MRVEVQPSEDGWYSIFKDGRPLAKRPSLVLKDATWEAGRMFGSWIPDGPVERRNGGQYFRIMFDPVHPEGFVRTQTRVPVTSAERVYCETGGMWARMF